MATTQHTRFDLGVNQDTASYLLPDGYCYSSRNMLYDKLGIARKRGGIQGLGATTTYNGDHLGVMTTDEGAVRAYSLGVSTNPFRYVNLSTGVLTPIGGSNFGDLNPDGGRPFVHYGFMIWPCYTRNHAAASVAVASAAGTTGALTPRTFTTPATVVLTLGDKQVPCAAADNPLTLMEVGQIIVIYYNAGATAYIGRVTRLVSTTAFEVYPTPTVSAVASSVSTFNGFTVFNGGTSGTQGAYIGGLVGMSFQGRILLGNTTRNDASGAGRLEIFPRRCNFTSTLLEQDASGFGKYQGAVWLSRDGFPNSNYFDIPGNDPITAMSPTGFGDAVIFSAYRTFRLTGNLSTQYGTEQSVTWQVREIPNSVGCISERSMMRTPRGVIFAHDSGIYTTDGSSMQPLLYGKLQKAWRDLVGGTGFKIYGCALVRGNHYYICGTSNSTLWGWLVNLDTLAWGFIGGKTSVPASWLINSAVQDPSDPSRTLGLKWWDEGGAPVSMTGGQLVYLDTMFDPSTSNYSDSDGSLTGYDYQSRSFTEDAPTVLKTWRDFTLEYKLTSGAGGASCGVTFSYDLDPKSVFPPGFWTVPGQDEWTITGATNATPIVITVTGLHQIASSFTGWVEVKDVLGNLNANGRFRVQTTTGSTVTLMGSYGSGAYISGGTLKVTESFDKTIGANPSGGGLGFVGRSRAINYRIGTDVGGGGNAGEFEIQGITHTYDENEPHAE